MATEQERNRGLGAYSTPGVDNKDGAATTPIITSSPIVSFSFQNIAPPSPLYITRDDRLLMHVASINASLDTITFGLRILRPDGVVVQNTFTLQPSGLGVLSTQLQTLTEGFLLSASAVSFLANQRGLTFARAFLVRQAGNISLGALCLFADYITTSSAAVWPNGRILYPSEGPGSMQNLGTLAPAAGAEFTVTIPTGTRWRLLTIDTSLVTSAAVANRTPRIQIFASGALVFQTADSIAQAASQTVHYSASQGANFFNDALASPSGTVNLLLPNGLILPPGSTINSSTVNLQAGDQYSNQTHLYGEQWVDQL